MLIHDPRPHLHQPMSVPQQLPQIAIFWTCREGTKTSSNQSPVP